MIINLERNSIFVTNPEKSPILKASLNFERVVDPDNLSEVGILPIFSIYATGLDGTEDNNSKYKEYYKELLVVMGGLFPDVYYMNFFEGEDIYCLKESIIATNTQVPVKVPVKTKLSLYKD